MLLENFDNAINDFEAAGRFDEQVAVAYEKRATDRREAGQVDDAQSDLQRAQEIRNAMLDKDDSPKPPQTAEGFDPDSAVK
jgi:tetratricopeptide (TPR) repeat protein